MCKTYLLAHVDYQHLLRLSRNGSVRGLCRRKTQKGKRAVSRQQLCPRVEDAEVNSDIAMRLSNSYDGTATSQRDCEVASRQCMIGMQGPERLST